MNLLTVIILPRVKSRLLFPGIFEFEGYFFEKRSLWLSFYSERVEFHRIFEKKERGALMRLASNGDSFSMQIR